MPSGSVGPDVQQSSLIPKHVLGELRSDSPTNILAPIQKISRQLQDPTMASNTSEFVLRCREIQTLFPLAVNLALMEQHQLLDVVEQAVISYIVQIVPCQSGDRYTNKALNACATALIELFDFADSYVNIYGNFEHMFRMSALLNHLRAQPDANSLLPNENETYAYDSPFNATPSLPSYLKRSMSLTVTGEKTKQSSYSSLYLSTPSGGLRRSMSSSYVPTELADSPVSSSSPSMYQTPITITSPKADVQNSAQYSTTSSAASVARFLRAIPSPESSPQAPSPSGMAVDGPGQQADSSLLSDPENSSFPVLATSLEVAGSAERPPMSEISENAAATSSVLMQDSLRTNTFVNSSHPLPLSFTPDHDSAFPTVNPAISPLRFTAGADDVDVTVLSPPQPISVSVSSASFDYASDSLVSSPISSFPSTMEHSPAEIPARDSSEPSQEPIPESPDLFRNTFSMDPVLATPLPSRRTRSSTAASRLISEVEIKPDTTITLTLPPPAKRKRADEAPVSLEAASTKIMTRRTRAQTQIQTAVSRAASGAIASERVRTKTAPVQMPGKENQKEDAGMD